MASLRGFRKDKEKKGQTTMLRYVRYENKPKSSNSDTEEALENSSNGIDKNEKDNSPIKKDSPKVLNGIKKIHNSKVFYVKPLSEKELEDKTVVDAKESGFDISLILKDKSPSSEEQNEDCSQDSFQVIKQERKRMRITSDDEEESTPKKAHIEDDTSSSIVRSSSENSKKFDDEMIEKLLDTYADLYPHIDRMELFEIMERWDYNFAEMTLSLDSLEKEQRNKMKDENNRKKSLERVKIKEKQKKQKMEERELKREERQRLKQKKNAELERKKQMWKMKARFSQFEENDEEEEDYIGKTKVYESESSENEDEDNESSDCTAARSMVLNFYNESSIHELMAVPGCSKKKADVILNCRPFENWKDLVYKFKSESLISTDLLNSAKDVLQMRSTIQRLMKQCERIAADTQNIVNQIIEGNVEDGISKQPSILSPKLTLKNYQLIGLNWLVLMHEQELNGVLADEMGLGKTAQAISFFAYLKEKQELEEYMCLIIVPTSTLDNWARELEQWCPSLGFLTYHGSQEERKGMRMTIVNNELDEDCHIILTTYNMISSCPEDRGLFKKMHFHTVVFDEAHMLKNMTTQRFENLMKIKCMRRLLLTGTPLQNNLVELMSILVFVMPKLFEGKKEELKKIFSMFPKTEGGVEEKGRYERERILQAQRIMAPFFLRRLKINVLKDLPSKTEEVLRIQMTERQEMMYRDTVRIFSQKAKEKKEVLNEIEIQELDEISELASKLKSPLKQNRKPTYDEDSSSNMLMKLRKLANHPLLTRYHYNNKKIKEMSAILKKTTHKDSVLDYIIEDFTYMSDFQIHQTCLSFNCINKYQLDSEEIAASGKLKKLDEMLPIMKNQGDRVLLFSQFVIVLDIVEEFLKLRGYTYRRLDGQTNISERQELIDEFNEDNEIFIFLLSTRAGGLGINLSAANVVILHDIDFNPYNDKQAEDRCHRVGQTRSVTIYRFITDNTIEDGIYKIACNKLQLEKDVTGYENNEHKKADVLTLLKTALGVET